MDFLIELIIVPVRMSLDLLISPFKTTIFEELSTPKSSKPPSNAWSTINWSSKGKPSGKTLISCLKTQSFLASKQVLPTLPARVWLVCTIMSMKRKSRTLILWWCLDAAIWKPGLRKPNYFFTGFLTLRITRRRSSKTAPKMTPD